LVSPLIGGEMDSRRVPPFFYPELWIGSKMNFVFFPRREKEELALGNKKELRESGGRERARTKYTRNAEQKLNL